MTFESIMLPDTKEETTGIALGDFNGDGMMDNIFGYNKVVLNLK